ncbi:MAG: V-type ATP synthase subunit E [Lachnospiraceae bacterium]|nr:V-type ATP synthase subunit E [Lachnospiraceae bacterium]
MTTEEKLQHFYAFSMESACREAEQMLTEYKASLDAQFETHKEAKNAEIARRLHDGANEVKREMNKTLSNEQLEIKRLLSKKNREIRHLLFLEVKDKLLDYKSAHPDEYLALICRKVNEARDFAAGDEMTIYIDPSDEKFLDRIAKRTGVIPTVSKESFLGGMRAVIRSKNILIDNSFTTLIKDAKHNFTFDGGMVQ